MADAPQDRLIVMLEARVTEFEKRMNRADQTMRRNMRNVESHAERMRKRVDASLARVGGSAFRGLIMGATAALAPILSVGAALRTAQSALNDFDKLGNRAVMLGTNVEVLQEFHYAAEQSGMAADNFDMALRRMTRRAAEAAQGTGAAKGAFKELGIELTDNEGRLKANDDLLREVADRLQRVPDHADKLRLAFQMFDTDGAGMVRVLADGSAGLDDFGAKARALGLVIDEHLIVRAQEMKAEFDTATTVLNRQFQQALIALAPFLVQTAQLVSNVAHAVRDIGDALQYWSGNLDNVSNVNLDQLHRNLGAERARIEAEILALESTLDRLSDAALAGPSMAMETWTINADLEERRQRLAEIADEENRINQILANRPTLSKSGSPDMSGLLDDNPLDLGLNRNKAAEAAVKQAEAVARLIENLKHEQAQLGRTAEEQELYNALKSVGVELESEYGQAIAAAVSELQAKRDAIEANAEAMKLLEGAANSALNTIIDGFLDGKDAGEIFGSVLRDIGRQLISMGVSGLSSGFANLFNLPAFANGTRNAPGGLALVGERGPEIVNIPRGSQVIPSARSLAALGGGSGGGGFTFAPVIDARGADIAAVARLEQVVQRQQVEFEGRVKQIVRGRGTRWR